MKGGSTVIWKRAVLLAGCAGLGWYAYPGLERDAPLVQAKRTDWNLPDAPRRSGLPPVALAALSAAPLWGAPDAAVARSEPVRDARWRVAAIFGTPGDRRIRIEFRDPSVQAVVLRTGDALPSGHRLVEIGERHYCITIGARRYALGVEAID